MNKQLTNHENRITALETEYRGPSKLINVTININIPTNTIIDITYVGTDYTIVAPDPIISDTLENFNNNYRLEIYRNGQRRFPNKQIFWDSTTTFHTSFDMVPGDVITFIESPIKTSGNINSFATLANDIYNIGKEGITIWIPNTLYLLNNLVVFKGPIYLYIYSCIIQHVSSSTIDLTNWQLVTFDVTAIHTNRGDEYGILPNKDIGNNLDLIIIEDSIHSFNKYKMPLENFLDTVHYDKPTEYGNAPVKSELNWNDQILIEDSADGFNKKHLLAKHLIRQYDYVVTNQDNFNSLFNGVGILRDISIFLKKSPTQTDIYDSTDTYTYSYLLNHDIPLGSNVTIHSDGAIVRRTDNYIFNTTYTHEETNCTATVDGNYNWLSIAVVSDNSIYKNGEIIYIPEGYTTKFFKITGKQDTDKIYLDKRIIELTGSSFTIYQLTSNINFSGWIFDGYGGVNGMHGSVSTQTGDTSTFADIPYLINSRFTQKVINCHANDNAEFGAYWGDNKTFNIHIENITMCKGTGVTYVPNSIIKNISYCTANVGGGVKYCNNSHISNITGCYAIGFGGGIAYCDNIYAENIANCSAGMGGGIAFIKYSDIRNIDNCYTCNSFRRQDVGEGGAAIGCQFVNITNITNCSSASGGGISGMFNSTIINIRNCNTYGGTGGYGNGGAANACNICKISNIENCKAEKGGAVFNTNYTIIDSVRGCEATDEGGGVYGGDGNQFHGIWFGNITANLHKNIHQSENSIGNALDIDTSGSPAVVTTLNVVTVSTIDW